MSNLRTDRRRRTAVPAAASAGLAVALLALTACGGSTDGTAPAAGAGPSGAPGGAKLKVGVMFPGSISDNGFMESAYLGLQRLKATLGDRVEFAHVEQVAKADYQQALVRFAQDAQLVISLGGQTDADVRKVAPQFPKVKFVEIGGPADAAPLANLALYDPQQAEAEFLSGVVAASLSKTGTVGFVGGVELPAIVNAGKSFEAGAKYARPDVKVLKPAYVGDFNDVAKAKQAAAAGYSAGADVLGQIVNLGKKGMAQAAADASASFVGGPIPKDCGSEPGVVGYVKTDIGAEVSYAVEQVLAGTWKAEQVRFGLTAPHTASDFILCDPSPAAAAKLAEAKQAIAAGTVKAG
ncbi:BMP family ABC transporter substrate-binding protein [Yinghuangia soli]|uniref:BMP family ABC transporter substrate-binding protein n=1 Tax=Yinghuangia soli TaxID=2908204 RepID=A0AA41PWY5_9ACTN|nr:BMP family ABC transporter substrate-binding protein [Yinghuangia soli]MCF2527231.1 BMP family ABC transporter substrate-binding protein [Yinghuangia soli]